MGFAAKGLVVLLAAYAGVAALVWAFQERLLFHPRPATGSRSPPPGWRLESLRLAMPDGTSLAGVLLIPPGPPAPVVMYLGGNAEEVTESTAGAERTWGRRAVLLVNYRGFGASGGTPGQSALVEDSAVVFDALRARADVDGTRIALHGRSLGTGVAVQLAAMREPKCIVLTSPFSSALDIAREAYPWLPVALLMRHPFDSLALAATLRTPLLVLVGENDTLIAPAHSERLAKAWGGPVELIRVRGGHDNLEEDPRYLGALHAFLDARL